MVPFRTVTEEMVDLLSAALELRQRERGDALVWPQLEAEEDNHAVVILVTPAADGELWTVARGTRPVIRITLNTRPVGARKEVK